jgi:RNA polymerase sigma-32 factor
MKSGNQKKQTKRKAASLPEVLPEEKAELESEIEDQDEAIPIDHQEFDTVTKTPVTYDLSDESRAISVHDPLRRYLEEIIRYPLLSPEEELRFALKLQKEGDIEAAKTLVSANLRLVVKIAFEYKTLYSNVMDLIQEGNIGLMKAVSKFDPSKGAKLSYYASWWIRSYILKYLLDNFRLVKIGKTQAQKKLFYHLMREKERLEAQGLLAGPKLLAQKLEVSEKDVIEMGQRLSSQGSELSIDTPIDHDGGKTTVSDFIADDQDTVVDRLAKQEMLSILGKVLPKFKKTLNEKELKVLNDRLLADPPKTLQEVADQYGLTRERARQIEVKVIAKLKEFLKKDL